MAQEQFISLQILRNIPLRATDISRPILWIEIMYVNLCFRIKYEVKNITDHIS